MHIYSWNCELIIFLLYLRQYGTQCASCKLGLCPEDLVRRAVNKIYHVQCFKCSVCKRQLNTGEQLYLVQVCTIIDVIITASFCIIIVAGEFWEKSLWQIVY